MQDKVNQFFRTIPVAKAVLLAVVFLLSAAFAGGCWWLKASAEKDAALADDKLKAQQTLALPYARLLERQRSLTALVKRTPSKPMPAAITTSVGFFMEILPFCCVISVFCAASAAGQAAARPAQCALL